MSEQWGHGDLSKAKTFAWTKLGEEDHGVVELFIGEHPHSRSDNTIYGRADSGIVYGFDGHRILIDVQLRSYNYLKESELSGDEIRKGGECAILADREQVYSFFFRDVHWALRKADHLITELSEHPSSLFEKKARDALPGRKIFYRNHPAIIERLILDQGCAIIRSADGSPFPCPAYRDPNDDERETSIKDEILSPHIWWWRD